MPGIGTTTRGDISGNMVRVELLHIQFCNVDGEQLLSFNFRARRNGAATSSVIDRIGHHRSLGL